MKTNTDFSASRLRKYWNRCAEAIKPYHAAPSTQIYLNQEKKMIDEFFSPLEEKALLKTDLWNEAKNTQIIKWILDKGARVYGMDVSDKVVEEASSHFQNPSNNKPLLMVADLRKIPFPDNYFDYIYSMGTVEHFPDYERALQEMHRVLKDSGRAIIGVPNRHDPFFRPFLIAVMQKMGLYSFGFEKSFSKKRLTHLLEKANFRIVGQSSLLFLPGFLRLLDLFFFCHLRHLLFVSKALLVPFSYLYNSSPFLKRKGYLLSLIVEKRKT